MKRIFTGIAVMTTAAYVSQANSQDYGAQIDALQNELLKMKQQMNTGDKGKAYFEKGKGLRVKSTDGKYMFQIKGRLMYDVGGLINYETKSNATTAGADVATNDSIGSEFRRLRFTLKGEVGNGWGFAFQPDFADGTDDSDDMQVIFKDALIYKKIKGFGKFTFGNQKAAAGLYENTSSNNLLFMERPMHNDMMNFGHRSGIGYDTSGALGKEFHTKMTFFTGQEASFEQLVGADDASNESFGFGIASHYNFKQKGVFGQSLSALLGYHYGYFNISKISGNTASGNTYDTNSARAQGFHLFTDKPIDLGNLVMADDHYFHGPQLSVILGQFFLQGEYQMGAYTFKGDNGGIARDDINIYGGSIGAVYAFSGNWKHSGKKGAISGFKCKSNCTQIKYQFESMDANDYSDQASNLTTGEGGAGTAHTFGINHYFNSNVRLLVEGAVGDYSIDNARGGSTGSDVSTIQARLHLKY